jgi:hypothetical protein
MIHEPFNLFLLKGGKEITINDFFTVGTLNDILYLFKFLKNITLFDSIYFLIPLLIFISINITFKHFKTLKILFFSIYFLSIVLSSYYLFKTNTFGNKTLSELPKTALNPNIEIPLNIYNHFFNTVENKEFFNEKQMKSYSIIDPLLLKENTDYLKLQSVLKSELTSP